MRTWLRQHDVPARDIITDAGGSRTRETMNRAAGVHRVRDASCVRRDVSAARTLYLARKAGIDTVAIGAPSRLGESARYVSTEAVKTSLALFESQLTEGPSEFAADRAQSWAIAER